MKAVITADIVNSTKLNVNDFNHLMMDLKKLFDEDKVEFYRGDSFQLLVEDAEQSLSKVIKCRLLALSYKNPDKIDIRLSLSVGEIESNELEIHSNMGNIYINSGRAFDRFNNSNRKVFISCGDEHKDFTFEIMAEYLDNLMGTITSKQARVLYLLLSGKTQIEVAKEIDLSGATVSQHVKAAHLDEIYNLLNKFTTFIKWFDDGK